MSQKQQINSLSTVELKSSLLTPDEQSKLLRRVRNRNDFKRWYVDWDMLDAIKVIFRDNPTLISELIKSAKDRELTKQFQDVSATLENLEHYAAPDRPDARWNVNLRVANAVLCHELHLTKLTPIPVYEGMDTTTIWSNGSASAGAAGYGSKDANASTCIKLALEIKKLIKEGVPFNEIWIPFMMFHRAQFSGETDGVMYTPASTKFKDRFIWGEDGGSVTVEAQHARPVIHHCVTHWYNYAGGDDPDEDRLKIRKAWNLGMKYWTSIDFSKFDQTIPAWLIEDCFSIIKKFYDKSEWLEIDWECWNFIHSNVITPGGTVYHVDKGIPSGSNYTQIIGSMCNFLMVCTYLASKCGGSFQEKFDYVREELSSTVDPTDPNLTLFCMGDDDLFFTRHEIDVKALSEYVGSLFGVKIHPDKTEHGRTEFPHFLKRDWRGDGEYREPLDMAIQLIHPEHDRTYENYTVWHILYGMFLTFRWAFPRSLNERFFIEQMQRHGGIEQLRDLKKSDLPGPMKVYSDKARTILFSHAKRTLWQGDAA